MKMVRMIACSSLALATLVAAELAWAASPGPVDTDAPKEFTTTKSGLKYRIRRKSDGEKPELTDTVIIHYMAWLDDGTVFDESYKRNKPAPLPLKRVVRGCTEGIQLIGKGGMIELDIPPNLGYGANGKEGMVPANARLHYLVELLDIK